ncbi:MAG: hypothetical protein DCC75_01555 [Proteobacteria bacterium]|nr:MAG: hypothetical protein DCC75_01555 [Pseudomonadota bacterium]
MLLNQKPRPTADGPTDAQASKSDDPYKKCQIGLRALVQEQIPKSKRGSHLESFVDSTSGKAEIHLDPEQLRQLVIAIPHALKEVKAAAHLHMAEMFLAIGDERRALGAVVAAQHVKPEILQGFTDREWLDLTGQIIELRKSAAALAPAITKALQNFRDQGRSGPNLIWSGTNAGKEPCTSGFELILNRGEYGGAELSMKLYQNIGDVRHSIAEFVKEPVAIQELRSFISSSIQDIVRRESSFLESISNHPLAKALNDLADFAGLSKRKKALAA